MDLLFEFIIDLVIEGSIEASKSKRIPKPIRYILLIFLILFFSLIIFIIEFIGLSTLNENKIGGIIIMIFGLLFLILCIYRFKKTYLEKKILGGYNEENNNNFNNNSFN